MAGETVSDALLAFVKTQEGLRLDPYMDAAGFPTIGYGHRIPSLTHPPITEAEADELLSDDLLLSAKSALTLSPNLKNAGLRLAAITDFCFNVGVGAYAKSQLRQRVNEFDWPTAAAECRKWVHAHRDGTVITLPGLVKRREQEAQWLLTG